MPKHTWTLTDVAQKKHDANFHVAATDFGNAAGSWQVTQQTLQGGLSDGVDLVEIDNGQMQLVILPTRGMGIWRATKADGKSLGWNSPVNGPVHPSYVPIHDPNGLGWLEGFDELVVRCGLESNGAPEFDAQGRLLYPLHGRIANRPAHHVELTIDEEKGTIVLRGIVEETRFHFQKLRLEVTVTTHFDSSSFTISDRVENYGGAPAQMQMLYHINIGEPLLGPGAQFIAPIREVLPRDSATVVNEDWQQYGPPVAGAAEQCYFVGLRGDENGRTRVLLKNPKGTEGTTVEMNLNQLPYFTLWKNPVASADGYVTGLEPATNYPNCRSTEEKAGRVVTLEPGEIWSADLSFDWMTEAATVERAEADISRKFVDEGE